MPIGVAICVGSVLVLTAAITATAYICSGGWRIYKKIREMEGRLLEADTKILLVLSGLNRLLDAQKRDDAD